MYLTLISCIAISGFGSHAFGSWKDRNSHYTWLRDALPYDLPGARVLTYGYDTRLSGSHSFQNLEDIASMFRVSLRVALGNRPPDRPLVFIAHSLGGLVLKQALIQMESGDAVDIRNFQSTYGILFFGVPNQGMDITSLLAMAGSQPNLSFLTMLSKDAGVLQGLIKKFQTVFSFKDSEIISLYETCASRTAKKDAAGRWSMSGDYAVLVDRFSAKSGRSWEDNRLFLQPVARNHSEMVKYSEYDDDVGIACDFLIRFAKAAPAVIRDRIDSLESAIASSHSNALTLAFRSQPMEKQAETEQLERPVKVEHTTRKPVKGIGKPSKEEKPIDGRQEGDNKTFVENQKRSGPSSPEISGNEDDLEMLADAGFAIEVAHSRARGLLWAARNGHISLTQHLLDRETPIEAKDEDGWTPLHWTAFTANKNLFRMLWSRGADSGAFTNDGNSTLHLLSLYSESHAKSFAEDYVGSASDRTVIGLQLLNHGIPVDVLNGQQETPLQCAVTCGLESMVVFLVSRKADMFSNHMGIRSLERAALSGHLGLVKTLVKGSKHTKLTPEGVLRSLASKSLEFSSGILIAETLLDAGVMIDAPDCSGKTALIMAVRGGYEPMTRLLLKKGANARAFDGNGDSALHYAARICSLPLVDLLLGAGADPLARNAKSILPLELVPRDQKYSQTARKLEEKMPLKYRNRLYKRVIIRNPWS